jgi:8-oxo-dGTP pyrophosphatase MutT (NUDIX family)
VPLPPLRLTDVVTKVLQHYWRFSRGLTLGVRGMLFDSSGRVLLVRHTYTPGWYFPGGGVEKGETTVAALAREVEEETGIKLTGPPQLIGIYANFEIFPGDHVALFRVHQWRQQDVPKPNAEIAEMAFFAPDDIPPTTSAGTRRRLNETFAQVPATPHW